MGKHRILRTAVIAALAASPFAAQAQVTNEELLKRIEEQEQKILVLERKLEIQDETTASAKEATPVVSAGPKGYSLKSADGKNQLRLRGTMHLDYRNISGTDPGGTFDTFVATRVRPTIEGTFANIYDFKFMPDFGQGRTVIQDAYINARFKPGAQLQLGKFKAPIGLERLQSANDMRWVQRGFPDEPRDEPRHRPAARRRPGGRALLVPGRLPQRFERRQQQRDLHGSSTSTTTRNMRCVSSRSRSRRATASRCAGSASASPAPTPTRSAMPRRRFCRSSGRPASRRSSATAGRARLGPAYRRSPTASASALAPQFYYYVGALGVHRRVHRGFARRVARGRDGASRGDRRHQRLAARGLVLPDGRGSVLQGLPAEGALLAERWHLGRVRDQGPRAAAQRGRQRLRRRQRLVRRPGRIGESGRLVRRRAKLVPQRKRQVAARLSSTRRSKAAPRPVPTARTRTLTSCASRVGF